MKGSLTLHFHGKRTNHADPQLKGSFPAIRYFTNYAKKELKPTTIV